jgi:hypothetical protein
MRSNLPELLAYSPIAIDVSTCLIIGVLPAALSPQPRHWDPERHRRVFSLALQGFVARYGWNRIDRIPMDLLFDLDGTLTNSAPGILRCFAHALNHVGRRGIDVPVHLAVGPPLYRVFEALLPVEDSPLIEPAIVAYRERYEAIGIFENSPYPGVHDALTTLRRRGHQMRVVTMKPEPYAARVLTHFNLAEFFGGLHAPALGTVATKKRTWLPLRCSVARRRMRS